MQMKKKMVVVGSINIDHVLNVSHFPRPGETLSGEHYRMTFGGKGANQAVAAGRSGAEISFIARIGDDSNGHAARQQLLADQVNVAAVGVAIKEATGLAMIYLNAQGENAIGIYAGANASLTADFIEQHQHLIVDSSALLMQLESPLDGLQFAAKLARKHQVMTVLNPAPARELDDRFLSLIDIITPNETEVEVLTGVKIETDQDARNASAYLHEKGIKIVLITLGSRGVWVSEQGVGQRIPSFPVKVIDTIGAGDTFNGAFVCHLLEQGNVQQAVRFAQAAAALSVSREGAQGAIPWRRETEQFLNTQGM